LALLILVVNAGSTSLKLSVVGEDDASQPVESLEAVPPGVGAVAHRVVHGGERFREAVLIDGDVERQLEALVELAPLHNAPALAALAEARRALPDVPHMAVFDTAFHATIPEEAATYAVPRRWREDWGIRRYGFHGLSVQWAAEQVRVPRLVVCHLGGGCSVTAVRDGRSVDTTMGFSPLEGVPMATRSGSIDPEIVLHLLRRGKLELDEIETALERESGLLGISDASARAEELERSGDPAAQLALAVFCYRVAAAVGAMATALGGLDALAFTGGVGQHSEHVRDEICGRLRFLGEFRVEVVAAREDVVAARAARAVLATPAPRTNG
jgi:acetate kinase